LSVRILLLAGCCLAPGFSQPLRGIYPVGPGGPGVDSFATVQEAAAALSARGLGGEVEFPIAPGSYSGSVVVRSVAGSTNHATTFRSRQAGVVINAGGARYAFLVESTHNVTLSGLRFRGARDSGSACVRFADADSGRVRGCRAGDSAQCGVQAERADWFRLDSARIEGPLPGAGSRGLDFRDCRHARVERCSVLGEVGTGLALSGGSDFGAYRLTVMAPVVAGIRVSDSPRSSFWRCFTRGSPQHGIHAVRAARAFFDSVTTSGPTVVAAYFEECDSLVYRIPMIVGNAQRAVWLRRSAACTVQVVSVMGQPTVGLFYDHSPGCFVESTQVMGIESDTGCAVLIDSCPGSSFTFCQVAGDCRRGIVVRNSDRVRLRHARLRGTVADAGIHIENSSGVCVWTCSLNVAARAAAAAGVKLEGASHDDTLLGMTILASTRWGISADSAVQRLVVASSYVTNWTDAGVRLDQSRTPGLFYNTVVSPTAAGVAGVSLRDARDALARDNIIWNRGLDSSACYRIEGRFPFGPAASDYNDLYVSGAGGLTARVNDTLYAGLADWRGHGSAPDAHSLALDPLFAAAGDFHLQAGSPCRDAAIPVPGIGVDLDGEARDSISPDIGADEFAPPGVSGRGGGREPAPGILGNPAGAALRVRYALAGPGGVRIRVFDVLGRVARVCAVGRQAAGAQELVLGTGGLKPGVYLLRLTAGDSEWTLKFVKP